ncbi:MAG: SDR family oxidoreductase [Opitutales bacterium]|jgi:short-subunit dehydrogenase
MNLLIFGATSAIAQAVARLAAERGDKLFLVGRDREKLGVVARDLEARTGSKAGLATADFFESESIEKVLEEAGRFLGALDVVLVAHGVLPDEAACEQSWAAGEASFQVNLVSPALIAAAAGRVLARQKRGTLAVIGSVAGDRGRRSNYYYGAAKGGLERFVQGLRAQLQAEGVRVVLIKPGMVDTPMTAHLRKGPLFAQPETVARRIMKSFTNGPETVYTPWIWRIIMGIIQAIPERIFKKMSI